VGPPLSPIDPAIIWGEAVSQGSSCGESAH